MGVLSKGTCQCLRTPQWSLNQIFLIASHWSFKSIEHLSNHLFCLDFFNDCFFFFFFFFFVCHPFLPGLLRTCAWLPTEIYRGSSALQWAILSYYHWWSGAHCVVEACSGMHHSSIRWWVVSSEVRWFRRFIEVGKRVYQLFNPS